MRGLFLVAAAVGLVGTSLYGQGPQGDVHPLTCSSNGGAKQFCPAPTRDGVLLRREFSDHVCRQGDTWGYDRRGVFVSGGCNAEFLVRDDHPEGGGPGGNGGNGYGSNGYGSNGYNNGNDVRNQPPPPPPMTLPSGTQLLVQLSERIGPDSSQVGARVPGTLASDLVVNGAVVAPAGTGVELRVTGDDPNRNFPLSVKLERLEIGGVRYHFFTNEIHNANESQSAQNGSLGNVLGSIFDKNAARALPAGSVYSFQLLQPANPEPSNR